MNSSKIESQLSGETEAVILIKAAPQVGQKHGETVCCAGLDLNAEWLRLYPISFRNLEDGQKFGRWDRVRFGWRLPNDDNRIESRRVDQHKLEIVGKLKEPERGRFLANSIVTSLRKEREKGRSLALIRPEIINFFFEKKTEEEIEKEAAKFIRLREQADLFNEQPVIPYKPCPFKFKYQYRTEDGKREGTCQDWEIEATYFKWEQLYGKKAALEKIVARFGVEYPSKGMALAMGTHSMYPEVWLINGVVRLDEDHQLPLF